MKILCVGRNYSEHAKELGNAVPENPVIFSKPDTALLKNNEAFYLPSFSNDVHHEVELVIKINKVGKKIQEMFEISNQLRESNFHIITMNFDEPPRMSLLSYNLKDLN